MPRFMAIILGDAADEEADISPEAWQAIMDDYNEFGAKAGAAGVIGGGEALQPPSTAVGIKVSGKGGTVTRTEKPFAEAKEVVGGFYLLDADDIDAAIEWAEPDPGRVDGPGRRPAVRRLQHLGLTQVAAEAAFRAEAPRALATLTRVLGDLDLAEDAVQDAFVVALERWPREGIPDSPGAWITTTARHKAIDRLRRDAKRDDKQRPPTAASPRSTGGTTPTRRSCATTCCGWCSPPATRCCPSRAGWRWRCARCAGCRPRRSPVSSSCPRRRWRSGWCGPSAGWPTTRVPYEVPAAHELPDRLPAVLATVHLLFTEGHNASAGDEHVRGAAVRRGQAAGRAARRPDARRARGARAPRPDRAHRCPPGDAAQTTTASSCTLADQDRTRWRHDDIAAAVAEVETALRRGPAGQYQLEAAIAACHATAPTYEDTDWEEIASLYGLLLQVDPDPDHPLEPRRRTGRGRRSRDRAWRRSATIEGLDDHHLRWAVEADLLRRLGRADEARVAYDRALGCAPNDVERRFLEEPTGAVLRLAAPVPRTDSVVSRVQRRSVHLHHAEGQPLLPARPRGAVRHHPRLLPRRQDRRDRPQRLRQVVAAADHGRRRRRVHR